MTTQTGEDWFLHFQDKAAHGRIVHLQPMIWKNDFPVIGADGDGDGTGEPVTKYKKPNVGKIYPFAAPPESDEFDGEKLGLQWQWQANPQSGWAEQNPTDWRRACTKAVRAVLRQENVRAAEIKAIGLSGQMHGAVLLDAKDAILRPALIWCDQRTEKQCAAITSQIGAEKLIELTCNPAVTGFTLPKLLFTLTSTTNCPDATTRIFASVRQTRNRRFFSSN